MGWEEIGEAHPTPKPRWKTGEEVAEGRCSMIGSEVRCTSQRILLSQIPSNFTGIITTLSTTDSALI